MRARLALLLVIVLIVTAFAARGADAKKVLAICKGDQYIYFTKLAKKYDPSIVLTQAAVPSETEPNLTDEGLAKFGAIILGEIAPTAGNTGSSCVTAAQQAAIKKRVEAGANFFMFGGWSSFQGGSDSWCGEWFGTPIADLLPVTMMETWDNCDNPGKIVVDMPDHPTVAGLNWASCPPIGGHNKVTLKPGAVLIAHIKEDNYPLIVEGKYGNSKILIYTSTYGGWDKEIMNWSGYKPLWFQFIKYVAQ